MPKISYPKLPARFKAKWVAALRSGKYKQGSESLQTFAFDYKTETYSGEASYCCLGVAADLCGVPAAKMKGTAMLKYGVFEDFGVPEALLGDFTADNPKHLPTKLAKMNDGADGKKRQSFKQIANWIERNL